jgi:hypothetical protein
MLASLASIVCALALASCTSSGKSGPSSGGQISGTTTTLPVYAIGATVPLSGLNITVVGFQARQLGGTEFPTTTLAMHYVSVGLQVANPTFKFAVFFASLAQVQLVDADGTAYQEVLSAGNVPPDAPNGSIPAGGTISGNVTFLVPDKATGLRLQVKATDNTTGIEFALS